MNPLTYIIVVVLVLGGHVADGAIGVNWGRNCAQNIAPANMVDILLQNEVRKVRIFTSEEQILQSLVGSGIDLTVSITDIKGMNTTDKANGWIQMRKKYFELSNIRGVVLGDYAFTKLDKSLINPVLQAFECLQQALNDAKHDRIKVSIPHQTSVLKLNRTTLRPSDAEFRDVIKQEMTEFVRVLQQNNSPFVISFTPFSYIRQYGIDPEFAIFENRSTRAVADINGAVYTNMFDTMYDSYAWALKKINASNVKIVVGEVGWPTDKFPGSNATVAEHFFKWFLPRVNSLKGTPMRPGATIDVFIHSIIDEDLNGDTYFSSFGIYGPNGKPKYKLDLSGQGRDIYPTDASGMVPVPKRWCLFNGDRSDGAKLAEQLKKACSKGECSTIAPGASCINLDFNRNVSYAFNMHYQFHNQTDAECVFGGLGYVSTLDPSTSGCAFPGALQKAQLYSEPSTGLRGPHSAIFVIMLSILGTLFWNL